MCFCTLVICRLNVPCNFCRVRFHYGHPDIFDRIFHITRGGISKASETINQNQDIFAGRLIGIICSLTLDSSLQDKIQLCVGDL